MPCFGALEAGGTKMVCAIGNEDGKILERISLPTRDSGKHHAGDAVVFSGEGAGRHRDRLLRPGRTRHLITNTSPRDGKQKPIPG